MSSTQWTDPATVDAAHAWLRETAAAAGHRVSGGITQPHLRPWSTVFRAPTESGDVYLKLCGPSQAHEPALTTLLAAVRSDVVPRILGVHPRQPWMLLADGGAKLRDVLDGPSRLGVWAEVLPPYAELQRALLGRADAIRATGTPDHGLDRLIDDFRSVLDDERVLAPSVTTFDRAARAKLLSLLPDIERQAGELRSTGIGSTAQHDDLHDANVLVRDGHALIFDWGDASLTHPFLSLGVLLEFSAERAGVDADHPSIARLRDSYLEPWTTLLPSVALIEAAGLGRRLATLTRALSWHRVVTLIPEALDAEPTMIGQYLSQVVDAFGPDA